MSAAPFKKVLVANRGEVAVRIIRACHELGIKTVSVYSKADADALHVKLAGESVCIGPAPATDSYLNISALISAAAATGAEAIHPGYGFLSENSAFADICAQCGICFIGPTVKNMELMGNKEMARSVALQNLVPIIKGTKNAGIDSAQMLLEAREIGFPLLIKARSGGGGRGMKIVNTPEEFIPAFESAKTEVEAAFGDPYLYLERFIPRARHVEVQIIGDKAGNVFHLGERDCSVQRRYQKVIEEAPAHGLSRQTVERMYEAAIRLGKAISYASVGTIEFLVDVATEEFFFIEMNTRLQVEHPVTEMVSHIDVVKEQIWVAAGREISFKQEGVKLYGHAIEARINAEDPETMLPSPGEIIGYHPPGGPGVRLDSAVYDRYRVPPYYDSLISKIIVHGQSREEAINKLLVALDEYIIGGIKTNMDLHRRVLKHEQFASGDVHTKLLDEILAQDEPDKIAANG